MEIVKRAEGVAAPKRVLGLTAAMPRLVSWQAAALAGLLVGLYLFAGLLTFSTPAQVFESPDEAGIYLLSKTFGETGKLFIERDYLVLDEENLLHPRQFATDGERIVAQKSLGQPLLYGAGYRVFGDNVVLVALLLAPLCLYFLYESSVLLFGRRTPLLAALFFGAGPLLYWFSRPYFSVLGLAALFAGGLLFLIKYHQESRWKDLMIACAFFCGAMLMRYEYVLFLSPLIAIALIHKHGLSWRALGRDLALCGAVGALLFVVPVLILNQVTYGDPFSFGTTLPGAIESRGQSSLSSGGLDRVQALLYPTNEFDMGFVLNNLSRFTIELVPAFTVLAAAGLLLGLKNRVFKPLPTLLVGAVVLYYMLYLGSGSGTLGAGRGDATYVASIVRYWALLYVGMFLLAGYFIVRLPGEITARWPKAPRALAEGLPVLMVVATIGTTMPGVWGSHAGALTRVEANLDAAGAWVENVVEPNTEPDAVLYTPFHGKYLLGVRDVATPRGLTYDPEQLVSSIARVRAERPVYVVDKLARNYKMEVQELDDLLNERRLRLAPVGLRQLGADIYRVDECETRQSCEAFELVPPGPGNLDPQPQEPG